MISYGVELYVQVRKEGPGCLSLRAASRSRRYDMTSVVSRIILAVFLCVVLAGCGTDGCDDPGEPAQIPANAVSITFAGGGGWGPVTFSHETHTYEYYDGVCLVCHDHEDVGTETHWSCRECHTAGADAENLCDEYEDHGCLMTQCQNCHLIEGSRAPDGSACSDCHE